MNVFLGVVVAMIAAALAVAALLLLRRRAPEGGYFADGDRAAGFFGVLATGFSILLGFVVFLAFSSYDESRTGAESEALIVTQQFETAQFMGAADAARLGGQLNCYARYVVAQEWPRMQAGNLGNEVNPWGLELFRTVVAIEPGPASTQAAYGKWLDQTSDREAARLDRVHGAEGIIPSPLWLVLVLSAVLILVFVMFFADPAERALVQGVQVGTVVLIMMSLLLVVRLLDQPYNDGVGGLQPVAMQRTLDLIENELKDVGARAPLPCDESGRPQ